MPADPGLVELLRDDLAAEPVTEQRMFGGLCFLLHGHMVTGTFKDAALYRVGKPNHATALALPGVTAMLMRDKVMAGFVTLAAADCADDARRAALTALALTFVRSLPAKQSQ